MLALKLLLWDRMSLHGASTITLAHRAKGHDLMLLVIKDSNGAIFGAVITEQICLSERDRYYGNGTMCVWTFRSGSVRVSAGHRSACRHCAQSLNSL